MESLKLSLRDLKLPGASHRRLGQKSSENCWVTAGSPEMLCPKHIFLRTPGEQGGAYYCIPELGFIFQIKWL